MITVNDIKWGSYDAYEGPVFFGQNKHRPPITPSIEDMQLAVITAAEGGAYDLVNMYDRGIVSLGAIQWIEAGQFTVSSMLGFVVDKCGPDVVLGPLSQALISSNATFKKNQRGQWRFFFLDERGEVDTLKKMQDLFLKCDGRVGSWSEEAKLHAKTWAAGFANIWRSAAACRAQDEYTKPRLSWFVFNDAKRVLFTKGSDEGWHGVARAAFFAYAINLPKVANEQVKLEAESSALSPGTEDWCISLIKRLTFGPNIQIYARRYDEIRPVLEKFWGVLLPKTHVELKAWAPHPHAPTLSLEPSEEDEHVEQLELTEEHLVSDDRAQTAVAVGHAAKAVNNIVSSIQRLFDRFKR